MEIAINITVTMTDGSILMGTSKGEATPDLRDPRQNVLDVTGRTLELIDDAREDLRRQSEQWASPHVVWPAGPGDPGPYLLPPGERHG